MDTIYFTLIGTNHYYGHEFMEKDMKVRLVKEPENEADKEAIRVELPGLGKVGYVANSTWSVIGESWSAGRIYDKIGATASGTTLYILLKCVLCTLDADSLAENEIIEEGVIEEIVE
ncbi:MAG: hypothetical protein II969_04700 [Anaerolineaceae bacterium]|nr:hypothetical protein [Anaerolineaceae bacterium]